MIEKMPQQGGKAKAVTPPADTPTDPPKPQDPPKRQGRPPLYETVEELEALIDAYFDKCDSNTRTEIMWNGKQSELVEIKDPIPYTMSGLAVAIGINRQSLLNYEKKSEFFGTIKEARGRVEADQERRLIKGGSPVGAMFALKNNFSWQDRQIVDNYNHKFTITRKKPEAKEPAGE